MSDEERQALLDEVETLRKARDFLSDDVARLREQVLRLNGDLERALTDVRRLRQRAIEEGDRRLAAEFALKKAQEAP
jgi:predicted nuclease with TOPRIM domain